MQVRVYNYNTLERVHQFEAHSDYLRSIAVHPTQPYLLTSSGKLSPTFLSSQFIFLLYLCFVSDDMLVKLWDWDNKWQCKQVFEGHTHYAMQVVINPKDNNTFATASLDRTIKVLFIYIISCSLIFLCLPLRVISIWHISAHSLCRCGNWVRIIRISLWKVTRKVSIASTTITVARSPT